ncbi:MAG: DUF805 domain-containing protein, partial [Alphaproteobacteria bacterium]|nr:DUF805 domain-containing protein [Alphaproteobacteria bacterium]
RDLKPENVMMLSEPTDGGVRLKLLDFGIARAGGGADTGATSLGTRGYMAPEQITAPDAAQPSADLYSLSVMFYELLVGVVPQGHWQPPSHGRGDVPSGIDDLVQKGLSNNPRSRPQTVADYLKALDGAIAGRPKPPPGPPPVNVELDRILEIFKPKKPAADDPHEQPAGQKSHWGWFMHCMRRYADGKGRAHRKEYWGFTLYALVFILVAIGFDSSVSAEYVGYGAFVPMTSLVVILLLIPPSLAVTSRRLHDLGRSGGSWLAAGNKVGFERGTVGDNPYGPDPLTGMEKAAP